MLRAGSLNQRITIQRLAGGRDEIGQPIETWANLVAAGDGQIWADVRYLNGTESLKSDAPVSIARASIRIRRRTDVMANMRVLHGTTVFDIRAVLPNEASREFVDLVCETGGQRA